GDNVMEVLHKKANEMPEPVRSSRPEVPPAVEALIERAMARAPDARPQSMRALAEEIRAVSAQLSAAAVVVAEPRRHDSPPLPAGGETPTTSAEGAVRPAPVPRLAHPVSGLTPASARELLRSAQTLLKAQRYGEASEAFRRLVAGHRERGMALMGLGNIAF